ncbi:hypothetical protein ACPXB5_20785 [Micromonospora arida]|uniref:hypothetical protein n=1 Tax=Micromonospora arida TaxID=2203715 RepID=UPI003CF0E04F
MSYAGAIAALAQHLPSVLAALGPGQRERLLSLLRAASGASAPGLAQLRLVSFLVDALPVTHPVRRAAAADDAYLGAVVEDLDIETAFAQIERMWTAEVGVRNDPVDVAAVVHKRLLAVASYDGAHVRRLGHDPESAALIRLDGRYPAFQFAEDGTVPDVVVRVNRMLRAERDPWGVADWWLSTNAWLDVPPVALLGEDRDDHLLAAAAAVAGGD